MGKKSYKELIESLTDKQMITQLYLTQCILWIFIIILSFIFTNTIKLVVNSMNWNMNDILFYGIGSAVAVIIVDIFAMLLLPEDMLDDGGINKKVFKSRSVFHIIIICFFVAITEEILFRGILQSNFGIYIASLIFAVLHFRYIRKIVLFLLVISVSFLLGWIYMKTENLIVPIVSHFLIDVVSAMMIRYRLFKRVVS